MTLRCKPGDLAIVLRGLHPNSPHVGKIVEVIELDRQDSKFGPIWVVLFSSPIAGLAVSKRGEALGDLPPGRKICCPDAWLMPIRDQPGADESLDWATVPEPEEALA